MGSANDGPSKAMDEYKKLIRNVKPMELRVKLNDAVIHMLEEMEKSVMDNYAANYLARALKGDK